MHIPGGSQHIDVPAWLLQVLRQQSPSLIGLLTCLLAAGMIMRLLRRRRRHHTSDRREWKTGQVIFFARLLASSSRSSANLVSAIRPSIRSAKSSPVVSYHLETMFHARAELGVASRHAVSLVESSAAASQDEFRPPIGCIYCIPCWAERVSAYARAQSGRAGRCVRWRVLPQ